MPAITQKGQVTIPKPIRNILKVKQGDVIIFEVEEDKVIVKKKEKEAQFKKYIGFLKNKDGQKADDIIKHLREGTD
jgi:AbrB family looped-hinge helix DNA binding protein